MLRLESVTAGYGAGSVVRTVSLTVPSGAVVALLGPNGAGKTTLLRVASGLLRPIAGQVHLDRGDLTRDDPAQRVAQGLCHIPEGRGVFRSLTVRDNLRLFAVNERAESRISDALSAFPRLRERLDQAAGTMSGGEQQMLALARSYIQEPSVILMDEVSMGLAPVIVDAIFEFLGELARQGSSLLIVEQFVTRALAAASYAYVLANGGIRFAGEPGELDEQKVFAYYTGELML